MPETRIVMWTLENAAGDLLFPQTALQQVFDNKDPTKRISKNGVILREHVPHDVTTIIGRFDDENIPDPDDYELGTKYYNTSHNTVHTVKALEEDDAPPGTEQWDDGSYGHRWTGGTILEDDRVLVDTSNDHVYHYHKSSEASEPEIHEVGGGASDLEFVPDDPDDNQ